METCQRLDLTTEQIIRFEAMKIAGHRCVNLVHGTSQILGCAQQIMDYVLTGEIPEPLKAVPYESLQGGL